MKEAIIKGFNNEKKFNRGASQFAWLIFWAHVAAITLEIVKLYFKY